MQGDAEGSEFNIHLNQWLTWTSGTVDVVGHVTKKLNGDLPSAIILILIFEQSLLQSGANKRDWGILIKPYSVRAIANRLGISKSTVHAKLVKLSELGYIERSELGFSLIPLPDGSTTAAQRHPEIKFILESMLEKIRTDTKPPIKININE